MNTTITLAMLRKVVSTMKANEIHPRTVKTTKEARKFTKNDPVGRDWHVGDRYYLIDEKNGRWAVAP